MIVENNHLQYQSGSLPTQKIAGKATGTFPCNDKQSASGGQQTLAAPPAL